MQKGKKSLLHFLIGGIWFFVVNHKKVQWVQKPKWSVFNHAYQRNLNI